MACCSTATFTCACPPEIGDTVSPAFHVVDHSTCQPADATVVVRLRLPNGTTVLPTAVRDSVGEYHFDYSPTMGGQHFYRFEATGAVVDAAEGAFLVAASDVLM